MLRIVVVTVATVLTCGGMGLIAWGFHAVGWQALAVGLMILAGTLFERWRYRRIEEPPNGEWQQTGEQFIDPSSGSQVKVMFNPSTGERSYVSMEPGGKKGPVP